MTELSMMLVPQDTPIRVDDTPGDQPEEDTSYSHTWMEPHELSGHSGQGQGLFLKQTREQIHILVQSLVHEYRSVSRGPNQRTAVLSAILQDAEYVNVLYDALSHYMAVLRSRPRHEAENGHVTIYDQALLELLSDRQEPYTFGALLLFLEKIMGNRTLDIPSETADMRGSDSIQCLLKRHALLDLLASRTSGDARNPHETGKHPVKVAYLVPRSQPKPRRDPLPQILQTYTTAKEEYMSLFNQVTGSACTEQLKRKKSDAAKFLRDTAENTLDYMRAHHLHDTHPMVPELEANFAMAREKVVALSGGRKRRFEVDQDSVIRSSTPKLASPGAMRRSSARERASQSREELSCKYDVSSDRDGRSSIGEFSRYAHAHAHLQLRARQSARDSAEDRRPVDSAYPERRRSSGRIQKRGVWIDRYRPS